MRDFDRGIPQEQELSMSHNLKDEQRYYAVFQPSAYSEGVDHYYPLQPKLWGSPVYGQKVPWLEPYQGITEAGLAANSKVPWLKNRNIFSRVIFVFAASGLGAEMGKYVGKKAGE
jgi:hypothetical protein